MPRGSAFQQVLAKKNKAANTMTAKTTVDMSMAATSRMKVDTPAPRLTIEKWCPGPTSPSSGVTLGQRVNKQQEQEQESDLNPHRLLGIPTLCLGCPVAALVVAVTRPAGEGREERPRAPGGGGGTKAVRAHVKDEERLRQPTGGASRSSESG